MFEKIHQPDLENERVKFLKEIATLPLQKMIKVLYSSYITKKSTDVETAPLHKP